MYQAKLFKNGNSVVLAIPEKLRQDINWQAGHMIEIQHWPKAGTRNTDILSLFNHTILTQEDKQRARKTTRKAH